MEATEFRKFVFHKSSTSSIWKQIGLPASEGPKLLTAIENGLNVELVVHLAHTVNWPVSTVLECMGLSRSTYERRKKLGRLKIQEGDSVIRIIRTIDAATLMMGGDRIEASKWLQEPRSAFGGKKPIELMNSETGAFEVIKLIHRVSHGVLN